MLYLLNMVIFHGYVSHNQMVYTAAASKFEECSMIRLIIARGVYYPGTSSIYHDPLW
jgi:hypothetical protein